MNRPPTYPSGSRIGILFVGLAWVAALLACALPGAPAAPAAPTAMPPAADAAAPTADVSIQLTSQALSVQATVLAVQEATLQAGQAQATTEAEIVARAAADAAAMATAERKSTEAAGAEEAEEPTPEREQPAAPKPTPTVDMEARLKKAKILVYEDTPSIGLWIKQSLDSAGYKYTFVGDAVGKFMENLNSGIAWDLIIIGAESKSGVRGEFWDVIQEQANRKVAIVAEVWYLDKTVNGRIRPFLTSCGIDYQKDLPMADSIYWLEPTHPVFNQPNTAMPLLHYTRYWKAQAGDLIQLLPGSDATLLAGTQKTSASNYGQIATCMEGRVIFQTFSNHDYARSDIQRLWQNYVDYTLRNHFEAVGE